MDINEKFTRRQFVQVAATVPLLGIPVSNKSEALPEFVEPLTLFNRRSCFEDVVEFSYPISAISRRRKYDVYPYKDGGDKQAMVCSGDTIMVPILSYAAEGKTGTEALVNLDIKLNRAAASLLLAAASTRFIDTSLKLLRSKFPRPVFCRHKKWLLAVDMEKAKDSLMWLVKEEPKTFPDKIIKGEYAWCECGLAVLDSDVVACGKIVEDLSPDQVIAEK